MEYRNVCAIVTLYFPSPSNLDKIFKILKRVHHTVIIDNTPGIDNSGIFSNYLNATYVSIKKNLGLSAAFNNCMKLNVVKDSDFLIFLDQDSLISEDSIEILIDNYNYLKNNGYRIGCIGPNIYNANSGRILPTNTVKKIENNIFIVECIITSSMLTTYKNLETIGFWNEEIFLDLADWDLCWRFINSHFYCFITRNAVLTHSMGKSAKNLGLLSIKEGVAIREYYQTRDCLKLLAKPYTPLKFKIRFMAMISIRPIIHLLFLPEKKTRLKYILLGMHDFIKGKKGIFPYEAG
jgi:rhamnosyltransferase